ncbi:site-specific DNA-methyltransferase [Mycoplasma anserisalpingitidis]|uniref:site-specific DNA-methyltransferase n=1 Tax=Mycoplasma anserisalpingitidis TaxID=519450 RepID=UPI00299EFE9B|nr:site-specific DNA-methyltransferase [Mycoplasma anserisalpingitidis]UCU27485.1 hypothetical protein K9O38_00355 [Mycoplasma anserisalpingitidis]
MKSNILKELEILLKGNKKYVSEDNKVLKTKVYEDILTMDEKLLEMLLSNETLKNVFFKEINGTLVFDKQQFAWFLESKEFLPDSYTKYTNKIGLTNRGGGLSN